ASLVWTRGSGANPGSWVRGDAEPGAGVAVDLDGGIRAGMAGILCGPGVVSMAGEPGIYALVDLAVPPRAASCRDRSAVPRGGRGVPVSPVGGGPSPLRADPVDGRDRRGRPDAARHAVCALG